VQGARRWAPCSGPLPLRPWLLVTRLPAADQSRQESGIDSATAIRYASPTCTVGLYFCACDKAHCCEQGSLLRVKAEKLLLLSSINNVSRLSDQVVKTVSRLSDSLKLNCV